MLVLQGAFAFEQLTGHQAPVATMQQAVERALGPSRSYDTGRRPACRRKSSCARKCAVSPPSCPL
jgi:hypothetical protein